MKITDQIKEAFRRGSNILLRRNYVPFSNWCEARMPFGVVIFQNIVEILTDIANDVTFVSKDSKDAVSFAEFKAFFDAWGKFILTRLFLDGFVVIGKRPFGGYKVLECNEYRVLSDKDGSKVEALDKDTQVYVMRSECWLQRQMSDRQFLNPFIEFLDNVLNASNTASARLGNLVVASPRNANNAPAAMVLRKDEKDELEKEIEKEYGGLREQKQIMLLPREMQFQVISLAAMDLKTAEKAKLAILAICDRIKVPANQVAIVDANSSKTLANGSELREGDFAKYQSFERLLNQTFVKMAQESGLNVDYTIYNKPTRMTAQV